MGTSEARPYAGPAAGARQMPDTDLGACLGEVAKGDQAAFEAVCARTAATVFGVVRSVVRDPFQAEEVCQEVLLEVWRCATTRSPR